VGYEEVPTHAKQFGCAKGWKEQEAAEQLRFSKGS
jgi:hypothetical protein